MTKTNEQAGDHGAVPATFPVALTMPVLADGERYVGTIVSADGAKHHHVILLPDAAKDLSWQAAMDWAASVGGELPDRVEGALLFATLKSEFVEDWYWTRETAAWHDGWAWYQYFYRGYQYRDPKDVQLRARAVRRLPI